MWKKFHVVLIHWKAIFLLYKNNPYFGGIVGRYCSLIENATFDLNNKTFNISKNAGVHNLHGGTEGFNVKVWDAELDLSSTDASSLILTRKYLVWRKVFLERLMLKSLSLLMIPMH